MCHVVCAMKCGGGPTQPTYYHRPITPLHQCTHVRDHLICFFLNQGNFVTLAYGPPYSLSCGGQVPDVGMPHYRDARMQHSQRTQPALPGETTVVAPRGVPASTNEVFPASQRKKEKKTKVLASRQDKYIVNKRCCDVRVCS